MSGGSSSVSLIIGIVGVFAGIAALVVASEVSKRFQAMLQEHTEAMGVLLNQKLSDQETAFNQRLDEFRGRVSEAERASAMQRNQALEAANRMQARLNAQDATMGETLSGMRRTLSDLEITVARQSRMIEDMQRARRRDAVAAERARNTPQNEPPETTPARPG